MAVMNLHAAARSGDYRLVTQMLIDGSDPNEVDDWGTPMLLDAIDSGDAATVRILLAQGADPTQKHEVLETSPLYATLKHRDFAIVGLLAEAGASLSMQLHRVCCLPLQR